MGIIWTIIIGLVAGVLAKLIMPGSNEPSGFVLTTILGIVGCVRRYLARSSPRVVRARRRCRSDRRSRGGHYRIADLERICEAAGVCPLVRF